MPWRQTSLNTRYLPVELSDLFYPSQLLPLPSVRDELSNFFKLFHVHLPTGPLPVLACTVTVLTAPLLTA